MAFMEEAVEVIHFPWKQKTFRRLGNGTGALGPLSPLSCTETPRSVIG